MSYKASPDPGHFSRPWIGGKRALRGCRFIFLVVAGALLGAMPSRLRAADAPGSPLVFVSDAQYPPYTYLDGEVPKGIGVDILDELARRLGRPIKIELMAWDKAQERVLRGEADGLFPMSITEARRQKFDFSAPVLELEFTAFTAAGRAEPTQIAALRGLRVAVTSGGFPRELLGKEPGIRLSLVADYPEGFRLLKRGGVDAVVADRWVGGYELARNAVSGVRSGETPLARIEAAVAVRKGEAALLAEIDRALEALRTDGTIDRIVRRWRPAEVVFFTREQMYRWGLVGVIGVMALLMIVMAAWMRSLRREVHERRRAQAEIAGLHQRLSVATRAAGIGIWDWDVAADIVVWDDEMHRLYRRPKEQFPVAYDAWVSALHPEDRARAQVAARAALRGAEPLQVEFRIVWPDGTIRTMQAAAQTFLDDRGRPLRMVGVNIDITQRRQAEIDLAKSEEKFSKAFRSSPVAIAVTKHATGCFVEVNESVERLLGYKRHELLGRGTVELGLWADLTERERMRAELAEHGFVRNIECGFITSTGAEVRVLFSAETIEVEGERHILAVMIDITAQKRVEAERLRLLHDLGERIKELTALQRVSRLLQADRPFDRELLAELVALLPPAWQYPDICEARIAYGELSAASAGWRETPWRQTARFTTSDGRAGIIEVAYTAERRGASEDPFLPEERSLIEALGEMLATHLERRGAVEALGRSEARFRSALLNSPVGMALVAPDGRWLEVSPALCQIFGYTREALLATPFQALAHPGEGGEDDTARFRRLLEGVAETYQGERRCLHRDGRALWVQLNVSLVRDGQGAPLNFIAQIQDITARKHAEESLAATAERLTLALRVARLGLWRHNLQTRETEWDDRMFAIFGMQVSAGVPDYEEILAAVVEEDRAAVQRSWSPWPTCERTYHLRFRVMHPEGTTRHVDVQGVVHSDALGRAEWAIGVAADITDIVQSAAEAERLRAQLQQAQKMEVLGTLAAGVAHDFNNLLTGINGFVDLAATSLPPEHEASDLLKQARRGAMSARDLVRRILNFSRAKNAQPRTRVDIGEVVRDTAALLTAALPGRISLSLEIAAESAVVLADAGQIQQVLMNLCTNGAHAIGNRAGMLRVQVKRCELDGGADALLPPGCSAGPHVRLAVTDSGAGMNEATRKRLFEPFFTTKKAGEGTGLGLSIVRDIVTAHGGGIDVTSEPGVGTTFFVYLPLAAGEAGAAPLAAAEEFATTGREERILIVDDEPSVAMVLRLTLQRSGYRPEMYTSPAAAWKRFADAPEAFDLLMVDQNMPEMSGTELVQRVRGVSKTIPVILLSGRFERTGDVVEEAGVMPLQKPFEITHLLGCVKEALGQAKRSIEARS
jgi:PAS domain S-box-containing protein